MSNSGVMTLPSGLRGGHCSAIRKRPWSSSRECDLRSPCGRLGQFFPSTAANSGSFAPAAFQRACTVAAEMLMASAGWWQVTHARPLVPIGAKKGWVAVSTSPAALITPTAPARFG